MNEKNEKPQEEFEDLNNFFKFDDDKSTAVVFLPYKNDVFNYVKEWYSLNDECTVSSIKELEADGYYKISPDGTYSFKLDEHNDGSAEECKFSFHKCKWGERTVCIVELCGGIDIGEVFSVSPKWNGDFIINDLDLEDAYWATFYNGKVDIHCGVLVDDECNDFYPNSESLTVKEGTTAEEILDAIKAKVSEKDSAKQEKDKEALQNLAPVTIFIKNDTSDEDIDEYIESASEEKERLVSGMPLYDNGSYMIEGVARGKDVGDCKTIEIKFNEEAYWADRHNGVFACIQNMRILLKNFKKICPENFSALICATASEDSENMGVLATWKSGKTEVIKRAAWNDTKDGFTAELIEDAIEKCSKLAKKRTVKKAKEKAKDESSDIDGAQTVDAAQAAAYIASLTQDSKVLVSGRIKNELIAAIVKAIKECKHNVALDLSRTTGLTMIDCRAFCDCKSLTSIAIPDGVVEIGKSAFYGCTGLTSIAIPDSVKKIALGAFSGCLGLTSIAIPDGVKKIGLYAFYGCTALTSITIPGSVTKIGESAFYDCKSLTSIAIPDGVTEIGSYAFSGCTGLTNVNIPSGVKKILNGMFNNCTGLTKIPISDGVTEIGQDAFFGCSGLTSIAIPGSVEEIAPGAFEKCTGLTSVTILNGVKKIKFKAFKDCVALTSIEIPDSVSEIDGGALDGCTGLEKITVSEGNKVYDSRGNCSAVIKTSSNALILGCKSTVIPASVTEIGQFAFSGCTGLTSIAIPNGATVIGQFAFFGCTALTSVAISDGVKEIGKSAFENCAALTSIIIPNSITVIADYMFRDCAGLTSIAIPDGVTEIGQSAFSGCTGLTNITIPGSVTKIGDSAFSGCMALTSVAISDGVKEIGIWAFLYCTGLKSITIPGSVTKIGNNAFKDCTNLKTINAPDNIAAIVKKQIKK